VKSDIAQARFGLEASVKGTLAARDAITMHTAESYFTARMARDRIDTANESVKALQASYDAAVKLKEAGIVTRADVLRSEVELEAAKERLLSAENGYQTALAALKTAMGLSQDTEVDLALNPSDLQTLDVDKVEPKERHDIEGMKSALAAAEAGVKGARSSSLPQVYLQADFLNIAKGAFFPRQDNTAGLGFAIRLPIWDSGASRSAVVKAYSERDQVSQELRSVVQQAELEVKSARLNIENSRARVKTTNLRVAAAEESLRVLQTGYNEGMTPLTDVLAAESALVNARFDQIAARYDVQIAQVKLLTAMGRADIIQS
jgi:outer membrane protein TolC